MRQNHHMAIATTNPSSGETVVRFASHGAEQIDASLGRAVGAFHAWRLRKFHERAAVLGRAAGLLTAERERLAAMMTLEMGKVRQGALDEIDKCAAGCQHY